MASYRRAIEPCKMAVAVTNCCASEGVHARQDPCPQYLKLELASQAANDSLTALLRNSSSQHGCDARSPCQHSPCGAFRDRQSQEPCWWSSPYGKCQRWPCCWISIEYAGGSLRSTSVGNALSGVSGYTKS
eukprot:2301169-Pleurochrysis_carterae.AAC.6